MFKKGAMFGLDARIALAIFGALSVISGAALFNAIQGAKVSKYIYEIQEIGKAYEEYHLTSGQFDSSSAVLVIPYPGMSYRFLESGAIYRGNPKVTLINDNWDPGYSDFPLSSFLKLNKDEWPVNAGVSDPSCDTSVKGDCAIFFRARIRNNVVDEANIERMFDKMDQELDNGDGDNKGRLRYYNDGYVHIYYQVMPYYF
jgi:hypothetical protein